MKHNKPGKVQARINEIVAEIKGQLANLRSRPLSLTVAEIEATLLADTPTGAEALEHYVAKRSWPQMDSRTILEVCARLQCAVDYHEAMVFEDDDGYDPDDHEHGVICTGIGFYEDVGRWQWHFDTFIGSEGLGHIFLEDEEDEDEGDDAPKAALPIQAGEHKSRAEAWEAKLRLEGLCPANPSAN